MKWEYWVALYTATHCTARGLRSTTIRAYGEALEQFRGWVEEKLAGKEPDAIHAREVLEYVSHLRQERGNGHAAVNRAVTILKGFYRAMVSMGHLEASRNPMAGFPTMRGPASKLPVTLSEREVKQLIETPDAETVLGVRDRAIIVLLYGTGIRASECAGLKEGDVDLAERTVRVTGKGGRERVLPLNDQVVRALGSYREQRGLRVPDRPFFTSRRNGAMSRQAIYERVRRHTQRAGLRKRVSPHVLRHTFASHLVQLGVGLVTIRDLLGHRLISSTQVYLHVTAEHLREAADRHPIGGMAELLERLLPEVKLPLQRAPWRAGTG